jgi:cell division protein FtsB
VLIAALVLVGLLYYRPLRSYFQAGRDLAERRAEVRLLEAQRRQLERRLALDESGATLLRAARRLGLVRPGERLFIVKGIPAWRRERAAGPGR